MPSQVPQLTRGPGNLMAGLQIGKKEPVGEGALAPSRVQGPSNDNANDNAKDKDNANDKDNDKERICWRRSLGAVQSPGSVK